MIYKPVRQAPLKAPFLEMSKLSSRHRVRRWEKGDSHPTQSGSTVCY